MKEGDILLANNGSGFELKIIAAPRGKKWTVRTTEGHDRLKSKSFLKKNYRVVNR